MIGVRQRKGKWFLDIEPNGPRWTGETWKSNGECMLFETREAAERYLAVNRDMIVETPYDEQTTAAS